MVGGGMRTLIGAVMVLSVLYGTAIPAHSHQPDSWPDEVLRLRRLGYLSAVGDHSAAPDWCRQLAGSGHYGGYMSFYAGVGALSYYRMILVQIDQLNADCRGTGKFLFAPAIVPPGAEQPMQVMRQWLAHGAAEVNASPERQALVLTGTWPGTEMPFSLTVDRRQRQFTYMIWFMQQGMYNKSAAQFEEIPIPFAADKQQVLAVLAKLEVESPHPALSPAVGAFLGRWQGISKFGRQRIMVVSWIGPTGLALVLSGWDDLSQPDGFEMKRLGGRFDGHTLTVTDGGDRYTFRRTADDQLHGQVIRNGEARNWGEVVMSRVP